jgi:predicted amidophosphoribosyltransferase
MARADRELLADADALIPVPLHWRRQWTRRFNQSVAFVGAISALCKVRGTDGGSNVCEPRGNRSAVEN